MMEKFTGRCLCEKIVYEITGELGPIVNCHCSKCRRWHGAAFRTRASVPSKNFKWLRGEDYLTRYYSSENVVKHFCKNCGANLISTYVDKPDFIGLPIGGLEQDPGKRPTAHIFVGSKSPWYEIIDDLPQYDSWPASVDDVIGKDPNQASS